MGTTLKALKLLDSFSLQHPELGLSQIARMCRINKATALRYLKELTDYGLVEQDPQTRLYCIGAAPLRLASLREAAKPGLVAARQLMKTHVRDVKETMHLSLLKGDALQSVLVEETQVQSVRVSIDASDPLPLHATASGHSVLAHGPGDLLDRVLTRPRAVFSEFTVTDRDQLRAAVEQARKTGWSESVSGFEAGVHGFATPIFGRDQVAIGAVAFAIPNSRVTPELTSSVLNALRIASREITTAFGGICPDRYQPETEPNIQTA